MLTKTLTGVSNSPCRSNAYGSSRQHSVKRAREQKRSRSGSPLDDGDGPGRRPLAFRRRFPAAVLAVTVGQLPLYWGFGQNNEIGAWTVLGENLTPEYHVVTGVRRMTTQQADPLRAAGIEITGDVIDKNRWYAFWDAPLEIPSATPPASLSNTSARRSFSFALIKATTNSNLRSASVLAIDLRLAMRCTMASAYDFRLDRVIGFDSIVSSHSRCLPTARTNPAETP